MARKDRATAITKNNIQDAFWSFYKTMPMDKIRINAVMERAGYNRGTFYEYFKSLDDVLASIELEIQKELITRLQDLSSGRATDADMLMYAVDIVMANRERFAVLLGENGDSKFRETLIAGTTHAVDQQLRLRIGNNIDFDSVESYWYFVEFVSTGMWGTLVKWASDVEKYDDEMRADLHAYFEGVAKVAQEFCTNLLKLG